MTAQGSRHTEELQVATEIIISDSSTDRTPEIAREMGAIVVEPDGKGYGYRYAFERIRDPRLHHGFHTGQALLIEHYIGRTEHVWVSASFSGSSPEALTLFICGGR